MFIKKNYHQVQSEQLYRFNVCFKILPKEKHSEKVISTDSCKTHQMFSLEEDCAILVQSIAKNITEVLRNTQFSPWDFPWGFP